MKKLPKRKIDRLSNEAKDLICDNCTESDSCKDAYCRLFRKSKCYDVYLEIKEELCQEEEVEDGVY